MDQHICELAKRFQANPLQFFHEKEIHSEFFGIARNVSGVAQTNDGHSVHLLRQDYNTLWRHRRAGENGFAERLGEKGQGDVGEIDFALLRKDFIQDSRYLVVMNKDETFRASLRPNPWPQDGLSPLIEFGLEFNMAHVHRVGPPPYQQGVTISDLNLQQIKMDCRKLANERVSVRYSVVFTHAPFGSWFNAVYVNAVFSECVQAWPDCFDGPGTASERLRLLIISPTQCFAGAIGRSSFRASRLSLDCCSN